MTRSTHRDATGCNQLKLRRLNEIKLKAKALQLGIPYDWMMRRLELSGHFWLLDMWEERLNREVDSWISWELNQSRWQDEFNREFF